MEKDEIIENKEKKIKCRCCGKEQEVKEYVKVFTETNQTGYTYLCKSCLKMVSIEKSSGKFTRRKVYEVCRILDIPFINLFYNQANSRLDNDGNSLAEERKIGAYLSILNSDEDFKTKDFKSSEKQKATKDEIHPIILAKIKKEEEEQANLDLWGEGFTDNEYKQLNKKFNALTVNYPLRTEMHVEMLTKYCKYALREEQALASGNTADAKYWGDAARKVATDAKINPSQLSAADLSDGISSFSKIAEAIEKEEDIIPILPKFKQKPQDIVDYTIWQYVNYIRRLQNLPEVDYQDLYSFLDEQNQKYGKTYKFVKREPNGNYKSEE